MSTSQQKRSQLNNLLDQFKKLPADKIEQGQILLDKINSFGNYMTNDDIREINTLLRQKSSFMNYGFLRKKKIGDKYYNLQDFQMKDNEQNKQQRIRRQKERIQLQKTELQDIYSVEQQFSNIENNDLLNLSCSMKKDINDFCNELQTNKNKNKKITISFLTNVSQCTQTNNFFLTFELFKDLEKSDGFYDIKLLQSQLINKLKEKYKNNNVTFFQSEQVKDESIPNCKILYDCFSVNKEFRNEIIKTWILRIILLFGAYFNQDVRKVYGLSTLLNYDITSRSRTTSNSWLRGISNFMFDNKYMRKIKNSIRKLISTYISEDLNRRYQDYGSIRIIFHRELHDYRNILNLNNKSNMQTRINLMNKQLKYLDKSNMDPRFTDKLVHKLYDAFQVETFNRIIDKVKNMTDWFFKPNQSKSENIKLQNDLNSDPVSLIKTNFTNIDLVCIRTDMLTFALFEYFQLCFKNFNYSINQSETSSLDNGPIVSIYVEKNQTFFQYFKINWNEAGTFSDPYVYVQSVEKNGVVVLRNAATSVPKRITLQKFGEMFNNLRQGETKMKQKQQLKNIRQQTSKQGQQTSKQGQTQMKQQLGQTKAKQQQQLKKIRQQQISKLGQTNAKQKEINKVETKNNIRSLGNVTKDIKDVGKNVATNAATSFQRVLNPSVNTSQQLFPTQNIWDGMPLQGMPLQPVGQQRKTQKVMIDVQPGQQQGNMQQSKSQRQQQGIGQPKLQQQQPKSQGQQGNRQQSKSQGIGQQVQKGISQQGQKVQLQPKSQRQKAIQAQVRLKQIQQARKKQQEQKNRLKEFDIKQLVNYLKFGSTLSDEEKNTVFYDLYTKYPNYKFNKQDSQIISTFLNENSTYLKNNLRTLIGKRYLGNQYAIKNGKIIKKF